MKKRRKQLEKMKRIGKNVINHLIVCVIFSQF